MTDLDLFHNETPTKTSEFLTVLPVSVIDIAAQKKRDKEDHSTTSSRSNYSPFPKEIATLCYEFFLKHSSLVFDPFAGWGERAYYAKLNNLQYVGYDTSFAAIQRAFNDFKVNNLLADSSTEELPDFDGMITCPPYWNLEKYDNPDGLDRCPTWETFLTCYRRIISRCFEKAKCGTIFCVMVGEWRKKGVYYDLEFETRSAFKAVGAEIIDQIIVSRSKVSKIKIMLPQCKRLGYSVRVHECLLVFKKPV